MQAIVAVGNIQHNFADTLDRTASAILRSRYIFRAGARVKKLPKKRKATAAPELRIVSMSGAKDSKHLNLLPVGMLRIGCAHGAASSVAAQHKCDARTVVR